MPFAVPSRAERLAEPGDVPGGRDLGRVYPQPGLPRDADDGRGQWPFPGLPVHLGRLGTDQVTALYPRADHGRDHPPNPVTFPCRGCGVDDGLGVPGLDILAGDRTDDRGSEPLAQPLLGVGVLARPAPFRWEPVRVEVPGNQFSAGPRHVRGVGRQSLGDFLQLCGQLLFRDGLALLPCAVLVPGCPPPVALVAGRVDGDPVLELDDRAVKEDTGVSVVVMQSLCDRGRLVPSR